MTRSDGSLVALTCCMQGAANNLYMMDTTDWTWALSAVPQENLGALFTSNSNSQIESKVEKFVVWLHR